MMSIFNVNNINTNSDDEPETEFGISRIKNMGNTCYMNSIIQCINHCPLLREFILNSHYVDIIRDKIILNILNDNDDITEDLIKTDFKKTILYQLHRVMKIMWSKDCLVTPASFRNLVSKKNNMFGGYMQHDSQEFLMFILDQIHEETSDEIKILFGKKVLPEKKELNLVDTKSSLEDIEKNIIRLLASNSWKNYIKKSNSIITELFTGMYHSVLDSNKCHTKSNTFDPFICLSVSIPIKSESTNFLGESLKEFSLYDCLDNFFSLENIDKDNKITCSRCFSKTNATKQISLWFPPKILIIQIKRFLKNPYGFTTRKIKNNVKYPIKGLNLFKYTSESNKREYKYNLFAVNIHSDFGGINSGHYYSYCKNFIDNKWYCYNDENTEPVKNIQTSDAYLLFYYMV